MSKLDVRMIKLEPMRVLSAYGFGASPEVIAHEKITSFLKMHGMYADYGTKYPSFGFNNPNPSPASPNYGYEIWVPVGSEVEPDGDIRLVEFSGGLYAVTRFEGLSNIGRVWNELVTWREGSPYKRAHHQWLEHLINPQEADQEKYVFDLYLPVAE